ncbi:glutamate-tRNA ligase [Blastomyces parvus]|uniref:glutamate--tRNA ligase n=1 Tax=Blastomyces parvus TaxID=2060905 RepID=A0A2B7X948_9EURO|nr:glutamate-tRNA ligase [Blastomyces parvus]
MAHLTVAAKANHALLLPVLLMAAFLNTSSDDSSTHIAIECADADRVGDKRKIISFIAQDGTSFHDEFAFKHLQKNFATLHHGCVDDVSEWITRSHALTMLEFKALEKPLAELQSHLTLRSFVVGYSMTLADLTLWGVIRGNRVLMAMLKRNGIIEKVVLELNAPARQKRAAGSAAGASYEIGLDSAKPIVTRFPPEPSGYLHIGHAKAALLNDYFAHKQAGTLICRFDDTNPSKETAEFQDSILHDLSLIGVIPDKISYSSDYFQLMYELCLKLISDGNAYADDTEKETMGTQRREGIPSKNRDMTAEESLRHFEEMKAGSIEGLRWCIRAKISVDDPNKALRDPVMYRCNLQPHHRTGTTWKIYPTYDFCAPVLDSVEKVTYALRTNEYRDRNAQYLWVQKALSLPEVDIWDFSRMNFVRTVLSKRKLAVLVEKGRVWGWDDPRMPTIRGLRRRGLTIEALREFVFKQGPSRNILLLEWSSLWAINKKIIDPLSPRFTAIDKQHVVTASVASAGNPGMLDKPRHNKNVSLGTKRVAYSGEIYLEQRDVQLLKVDEEITLMNWGNAFVRDISLDAQGMVSSLGLELNLAGDVKKTDKKVTWLSSAQELVPVQLIDFDYLITKDKIEKEEDMSDFLTPTTEFRSDALADCNISGLNEGNIIQFERKGYYRLDKPFTDGNPAIFFSIPTGKQS